MCFYESITKSAKRRLAFLKERGICIFWPEKNWIRKQKKILESNVFSCKRVFLIPLSPYITPCLQHTKTIKYQVTEAGSWAGSIGSAWEVNVTEPQPRPCLHNSRRGAQQSVSQALQVTLMSAKKICLELCFQYTWLISTGNRATSNWDGCK